MNSELWFNIVTYFFVIFITILVHELGHYFFLRIGKVNIEEFAMGFGKVIYKKGIFSFRLLPLGGFVKPNHYQLSKLRVTNTTLYFFSMAGGLIVNLVIGIASILALYIYFGSEQTITLKQLLLHEFLHNSEKFEFAQQDNLNAKLIFQLAQINISVFIGNCTPFVFFDGYKIASLFSYPIIKMYKLTNKLDYIELAGLVLYWGATSTIGKLVI